ncbi:serine/threonine-protein kinase [Microbispora triticiradicis]|uniref:serine/threonine-protein kinase n=1 Tax=Microbispora triticiradicis TaxID=2200763 RepID=UPI001AD6E7E0|nr:serine/threonine-protein kinase [Microbispora triticiradicis]MBO4275330.1 protein kinase [Microbispora triticiradicis]
MTTDSDMTVGGPARPGQVVVGRYELRSLLGRGGMGAVWLAWDQALERLVAMKEIPLWPYGERAEVQRERALREARSLAQIGHPSIVVVHDVFEADGRPWIVMAHVEGVSLEDKIKEGVLAESEAAAVARDVLGGLTAAHAAGVVHRDVKPANILISRAGRVVLVDFGIAQMSGTSGLTARSRLLGTPEFMAPERIKGEAASAASDLWSLGVTLFWAVEGRSPFRRGNEHATMLAVISDDPEPTRPGPISRLVVGLLEKDPARRMGAREADARLRAILDGPAPRTAAAPGRGAAPEPARKPPAPASGQASGREREAARVRAPESPSKPPAPAPAERRPAGMRAPEPPRKPLSRPHGDGSPAEAPPGPPAGASQGAPTVETLRRASPAVGARLLLAQPRQVAASLLDALDPATAGALLDAMAGEPSAAATVLALMGTARAGRVLDHMAAAKAAAVLRAMPTGRGTLVMAGVADRSAAEILTALGSTTTAVRLVESMTTRRAWRVLDNVPPAVIAALLRASTDGRADRLLSGLSPAVRRQITE